MFKKREGGAASLPSQFWIYIIAASLIVCWIGWKTQTTANRVDDQARQTSQFAKATQDCLNSLAGVLKARALIATQNDEESQIQRNEVALWLRDLLNPPPDIAVLQRTNQQDPRYQEWGLAITRKHLDVINKSQAEQERLDTERARHPIPDPSCGAQVPGS